MGRPKIKEMDSALELEKLAPTKEAKPKTEETLEATETVTEVDEKPTKNTKTKSSKSQAKVTQKNKTSQRYSKLLTSIDKSKTYSVSEAVTVIKKTSDTKFDSSIEVHINVNIDPSKGEQQIRTTTTLPSGTGKKVKILVFGAKEIKKIKDLGAEVGTEATLEQIEKGKINFDKVVTSPDWMPKLARVAKVLGPKGLMPNPKSGTISSEPEKVVESLGSGLVEIKTESLPIIHVAIGKASFKEKDLEGNLTSLLEAVKAAKPTDLKKELISSVYLTSTMGPSVKLDLTAN